MNRFDKYFEWLMPWEGETYEDDPDDAGGATKFGIDQRSHPDVNIRNLTRKQAKAIYLKDYWNAVSADSLPAGVGEVVCDIAVNNGKGRAAKWLQEAVNANTDGIIGPCTIKAAGSIAANLTASVLLRRRESFYRSIAKGAQAKFLQGWLNRNNSLARFINLG